MRTSFVLLLFILMPTLNAQKSLILTTGGRIEFHKIKSLPNYFELKFENSNQRLTIENDMVLGYLDNESSKVYYKVPFFYIWSLIPNNSSFEFLERKVEGRINVYEKITQVSSYSQVGGGSTTITYSLFLQKDSTYVNVFGLSNKRRCLQRIEELIGDDPETLQKFNSNFKLKYKNVISLIDFYNTHQ